MKKNQTQTAEFPDRKIKNAERDNMHSETEDPRVSANHITRSCQPITLRNDLRITHSFWSLKTLFFGNEKEFKEKNEKDITWTRKQMKKNVEKMKRNKSGLKASINDP